MIPSQRTVFIYYTDQVFQLTFPLTYDMTKIKEWMKTDKEFQVKLQQANVPKIESGDILVIRANSQEANPALDNLTLSQFVPGKKVMLYVSLQNPKPKQETSAYYQKGSSGPHFKDNPVLEQAKEPRYSKTTGVMKPEEINLDSIVLEVQDQEKGRTMKLNIKRAITFQELLETASIQVKDSRTQIITKGGGNERTSLYSNVKYKPIESAFPNDTYGNIIVKTIHDAGSQ